MLQSNKNTLTKIRKPNRMSDAVNVSLRDILMKDLLNETELKDGCSLNSTYNELQLFNFFVDQYENFSQTIFNLSINGEPASKLSKTYEMFLVPGNYNDKGVEPYKIIGKVRTSEPDTIVQFNIPTSDDQFIFSQHINGYSYSNYVVYAIFDVDQINAEIPAPPPSEGGGIVLTQNDSSSGSGSDNTIRLLLGKGKIYKTNLLYDLVESKLDG